MIHDAFQSHYAHLNVFTALLLSYYFTHYYSIYPVTSLVFETHKSIPSLDKLRKTTMFNTPHYIPTHNGFTSSGRRSIIGTRDLHSLPPSEPSPPNQSWLHFLQLSGPPRLHVLVMCTFRQGRPCATHQCKQVASRT